MQATVAECEQNFYLERCRLTRSCLRTGEQDAPRTGRVNELFVYNNFAREAVEVVEAGDICALTGIANASIGDTICSREFVNPLPTIEVCMLHLLHQQRLVDSKYLCRLDKPLTACIS